MLTQVRSYQTSDKQLHTDRTAALIHEFGLEMRGLIQSNGNQATYSTTDIAKILVKNADALQKTISKYKTAIGRATKKK